MKCDRNLSDDEYPQLLGEDYCDSADIGDQRNSSSNLATFYCHEVDDLGSQTPTGMHDYNLDMCEFCGQNNVICECFSEQTCNSTMGDPTCGEALYAEQGGSDHPPEGNKSKF